MHIMVDLETMGSTPGSVVASIGAVAFDPVTGVMGPEFYRVVSMGSAAAAGLTFDADTIGWWLDRGDEARAALGKGALPLGFVLQDFAAFWASAGGVQFWGHGANFDDPLLAAAYRAVGQKIPWRYTQSRCTRTIFECSGITVDRAVGTHHNALDDARAQADAVCRAYVKLGLAQAQPAVS